ncbi:MAG: LPS biosynthesis protein [Alteromonadaceae bacterium]|nr:MAG: LPS biosynthesis protein [Alteromonadaceae bacterium]
MRYCIKCVQPDTRPQIEFDEHGVCPGCNYADTLKYVNWDKRKQELLEFCEPYRSKHGEYDCIVGVSGGKDSTRQALYVRDVLHMNPLLVSLTYSPEQQTERGAYNIANLAELGFDVITIGTAPTIWKNLVKKGFHQYGNWARSTELALFSSVPRFAVAYQINVIFWGENPMLTLGEVSNLGKNSGGIVTSTLGGNTLGGGDISWLLDDCIKSQHILQYRYPFKHELDKAALRFVYLGYYWQSWSKTFNACFSGSRGLDVRSEHPEDIGDDLGVDALDDDWVSLNQMLKYYKLGFGKVTDNVNEKIRQGELSRADAIELVKRFDGRCSDDIIDSFCAYIGCSQTDFWKVVESYVNPKLFKKTGETTWELQFTPH